MRAPLLLLPLVLLACDGLKEASTSTNPPASEPGNGSNTDSPGGATSSNGAPTVTVEPIVTGRSRLGARSSAGFRPWKSGIAVHDGKVFWVEGGSEPGLYSVAFEGGDVTKVAALTRPASFVATAQYMYIADTTVVKRFAYDGSAPATIASGSDDVVNVAADTSGNVFWTSGDDSAVNRTASGTTSTPIYSNGTPVGMAVAADRTFWAGVDISGQIGALQSMKTNGTGSREVSRFNGEFQAMGGNAQFLYYARGGNPSDVHRLTVSTNRDEVVDRDALGVTDFAFDDQYAYWAEPGDSPDFASGQVRRVAHDGKTAETLAVSVAHPIGVAVSGKTVFVAAAGTSAKSWGDGAILRLTIAD